jgi:hypothetical protein
MEYWKRVFIQNFNMERVASELLDMIQEDELYEFIIRQFNENFTYEELYNLFKNDMNDKDLQHLLEEIGHNFKVVEENE